MPWCPSCKEEFVEGRTTCSDCGGPLVDELPGEEGAPYAPDFTPRPFDASEKPELLLELPNREEADKVEALVLAGGVPVNREYVEGRRHRLAAIGLYVPEAQLERATEILEEAGYLQPVDEALLELLEDSAGEEAADAAAQENVARQERMERDGDDMEAYREAAAALPQDYPAPMEADADDAAALLLSVATAFEADSAEAVVKMERIPVWRQQADSPVWGNTHAGVDLYVPSKLLEQARQALVNAGHLSLEPEEKAEEAAKKPSPGWKILGYGALGAFFLFIIIRFVRILIDML